MKLKAGPFEVELEIEELQELTVVYVRNVDTSLGLKIGNSSEIHTLTLKEKTHGEEKP